MVEIGNRIITQIPRPSEALLNKFSDIPSSNIGDIMHRLYCMNGSIKAMSKHALLGPAVTVKVPEGDNVFLHLAMEVAQPGDVIVVDGAGCESRALMGEMMFTYAQSRGIAGFVLDGAIRDAEALERIHLPVYARAITPQGPLKNGPGEINCPISCGGQVVMPGDIIAGDGDGICVIPLKDAAQVYQAAREKLETELRTLEEYHNGLFHREKHMGTYIPVAQRWKTDCDSDLLDFGR